MVVGRIELLYPFPENYVREMIEGYPNLEQIVWVQEEPKNMGAWMFIEVRLRELTSEGLPVLYVGKPARPSPAQGSAKFHAQEHADLVRRAFGGAEVSEVDKAAVQETQERTPASRTD